MGDIAYMGKISNVYKILVGMPEEKRQLGRFRHRWHDNMKMVLMEIVWED
jgi:hypothetical protein